MTLLDVFNRNIPSVIDKNSDLYKALIGQEPFTVAPDPPQQSAHINCGALCNELEWARLVTKYVTTALHPAFAAADELSSLVNELIDLPRFGSDEPDDQFRSRYRFLTVQSRHPVRATRGAILGAVAHVVADMSRVRVAEWFDSTQMYFELRVDLAAPLLTEHDTAYIDDQLQGWVDKNFIWSSTGMGAATAYLQQLLDRVKASGVEAVILLVSRATTTKTVDAVIGTVRRTVLVDATVRRLGTLSLLSDAEVV